MCGPHVCRAQRGATRISIRHRGRLPPGYGQRPNAGISRQVYEVGWIGLVRGMFSFLFIVGPHPDDFDRLEVIEDLVDQAMLYVDSSGISAGKVSYELLVWRPDPIRVFSEDVQ
jgi:hypothetical protein